MDGRARARFGEALKATSAPALVRSAFELPADQRAAIHNALNETFSTEVHLRFETAPDLVAGIELSTNGQKLAWSISEYLGSLEKGVGDLLKEKDSPSKAKPRSDEDRA
jgi:F-type H+-transporting ATPase subunit b